MMTNGPAADIGEIMKIDFPRPRNRDQIMEQPEYYHLRNYALDFLYNRFALLSRTQVVLVRASCGSDNHFADINIIWLCDRK